MHARTFPENSPAVTWPLAGSLLLTAAVVAFVCVPPSSPLHSWRQIFTLATTYLLVAGTVHAIAVWGICRAREEDSDARTGVWPVVWAAWVAIVWLPLIALLTQERSQWVAVVLPVTAIFATILLKGRASRTELEEDFATRGVALLTAEEIPLWEVPIAAVGASVAMQIGIAMMAAGHAWTAGCLLGAAAIYPVERWLERLSVAEGNEGISRWRRTSAGNSIVVWLLMVLALVPFMAAYAAGELSGILGIQARPVHAAPPPLQAHSASNGYSGIILVMPRRAHEIVVPVALTGGVATNDSHRITFDGVYWYFKQPRTQPASNARIAHGDPIKNHIFSTDHDPLLMEAHQPLGKPVAISCCRSLRVEVDNADNVPGTIALEVLLRDTAGKKSAAMSLGTIVLPSSAVSPMPLKRGTVEDHVTFQLPQAARGRSFNEIVVRLKPESLRAQAGAKVSIRDFVLQP